MSSEPEWIKIRFGEGERGWAIDLGDGKAKIDNLPLESTLNMGDVVRIEEQGGKLVIKEVLERPFPMKSGITYGQPYEENYRKMKEVSQKKGWPLEGMIPGRAILAHPARTSANDVLVQAGVKGDIHILMGEDTGG